MSRDSHFMKFNSHFNHTVNRLYSSSTVPTRETNRSDAATSSIHDSQMHHNGSLEPMSIDCDNLGRLDGFYAFFELMLQGGQFRLFPTLLVTGFAPKLSFCSDLFGGVSKKMPLERMTTRARPTTHAYRTVQYLAVLRYTVHPCA